MGPQATLYESPGFLRVSGLLSEQLHLCGGYFIPWSFPTLVSLLGKKVCVWGGLDQRAAKECPEFQVAGNRRASRI